LDDKKTKEMKKKKKEKKGRRKKEPQPYIHTVSDNFKHVCLRLIDNYIKTF